MIIKRQLVKTGRTGNFPGSPVVKTPHFYCKEWGFDPQSEN